MSRRQRMALLFGALLSLVIRGGIRESAARSGEMGWLAPLLAIPALLLLYWVICRLLREGDGGGLCPRLFSALGPVPGRVLAMGYCAFAFLLLLVQAEQSGRRFLGNSGEAGSFWLFLIVLLLLLFWALRGKLSAFARAGEVLFLLLSVALGLLLILGAADLKPEHILPWSGDRGPGLLRSGLGMLALLVVGAYGAFLPGRTSDRGGGAKWIPALCLTATAIQLVVFGMFGPELTAQLSNPFFEMVRGIRIGSAQLRMEALAVALWLFSDYLLLGLLGFACLEILRAVFGLREGRALALPLTAAVFVLLLILDPKEGFIEGAAFHVIYGGNLLLLGLGLPLTLLMGTLRKKAKKE